MLAQILNPFFDANGRKYIMIKSNGIIYNVKIPFRYNRVMCCIQGLRPIQEYEAGEIIDVEIERKVWDGEIFYILKSLKPVSTC